MIELQDTPLHISRRKSVALLAYLSTTSQAHSRDSLATMFWPEHDQSKARANLRRELSRIKTTLNVDLFTSDREQVAMKQAQVFWLDIAEFQSRLRAAQALLSNQTADHGEVDIANIMGDIQGCVALFAGEFMAGFSLPDCPQFDEWQFFQRESLSRSLLDALQKLITWHIVIGEYEKSIQYARQVLSLDDLSEPAHRQLMQLYAWSGQRGAAIRQYELCVNLLQDEIGVEPEEETVMLFEAIKTRQLAAPDSEALRQAAPWISGAQKSEPVHEGRLSGLAVTASRIDLAVQATPFIGREQELDQLVNLLGKESHFRLINVVGPGGVGKTRLVLEAVKGIQDVYPDGVYIIPLASLSAADQIVPKIAEQLNFSFHAAAGQQRQLFEFLRQKQLLLVMDNFEHLISSSFLVAELLQYLPEVKVLVTSRQRLNLSDEMVLTLGGMHYPDVETEDFSSEDISKNDAITLLVQSAQRVNPDFNLAPGDLEPAARLCKLVEGMPLAIILAASWLELLSLEEIIKEISQNLDFLESQAADIPERQRSLRAVFNASWDALDKPEQVILERLTIFRGSFTREAALAVTKTSLTILLGLIQKAWLQRNQNGHFQIHELQRQYAFEKLQKNASAWEAARDEHAAYYTERLEQINQEIRGPAQDEAFSEIESEFVNIQIAWNWLVERGQFEALIHQVLPSLYRYCEARIISNQLLPLVEVALQGLDDNDVDTRSQNYRDILLIVQASFYSKGDSIRLDRYDILIPPAYEENIPLIGSRINTLEELDSLGLWASLFAYLYGRFVDSQKGQDYLRHLVQKYRQEDQPWELGVTLDLLGGLNLFISLDASQRESVLEEAGNVLTEALSIFERLGDRREHSYTLLWLGGYHAYLQNWDEAILIWREAQVRFDQIGDPITLIHWLMGDHLFKVGDYEAAFQYYQQIREKYLQRGHKRIAAYALSIESIQALRYSDINHALRTREQSLRLSQDVHDEFGEAWGTWEMGEIHRVSGNHEDALQWFERAKVMFEHVNESNGLIFYHRGLGDVALAREDYAGAYTEFDESCKRAVDRKFTWGAAYAQAGMGRAAIELNNFDAAREHLSESLQSVSTIEDIGLALLVLNDCANLYTARGELEPASEIFSLVAGHYATWKEIKEQAAATYTRLQTTSALQLDTDGIGDRLEDIWDLIKRLLKMDFKKT
jgi:predicted ATPase/DNA-binding SARP family transcriptional activator